MKFFWFLAAILLTSPAMAAERCEGRYQAAAEMVDAAIKPYDTLYSGGAHWHQLDHVGATLDLYRLWRGLQLQDTAPPSEIRPKRVNSLWIPTKKIGIID